MHHAAVAATMLRKRDYDYSVRDTEPTTSNVCVQTTNPGTIGAPPVQDVGGWAEGGAHHATRGLARLWVSVKNKNTRYEK